MQNVRGTQVETNVQFLTAEEAIAKIPANGPTIMVGGFGLAGTPEYLLQAVINRDELSALTIMSNNISVGSNLNELFLLNRIKKAVGSYYTNNKGLIQAYNKGRIEIELIPQGTFSEALRLGGSGIPAFYTPTSAGTELAEQKESRIFNGREYVLEHSLRADVALVKIKRAISSTAKRLGISIR